MTWTEFLDSARRSDSVSTRRNIEFRAAQLAATVDGGWVAASIRFELNEFFSRRGRHIATSCCPIFRQGLRTRFCVILVIARAGGSIPC